MVKLNFEKTPDEIVDYLKNKGFKLTFDYDELIKEAHHKTFTVAKVTRADLLNDIFTHVTAAMKDGTNVKEFKEMLIPKLKEKGWFGETEIVNPSTGEVKRVRIDSRRIKNIFNTNMRVAYQQYRYKQMIKLPASVYWVYKSALLENTRDEHAALHNMVKHRDDVIWATLYPPNDWGCVCIVVAMSKKELDKRGLKVHKGSVENIASKDWNYNVGKASSISSLSKIDLSSSLAALSLLRKNDKLKDMSEEELKKRFYKTVGVKEGDVFIDKVNDPMIIDDNLFSSAGGHTKIKKRDRHLYLDEIAQTIKDPDEIYLEYAKGKISKEFRLLKKMFRYYDDNGKKRAILIIFEYLKNKTQGVTAYFLDNGTQVDKRRIEKLIYRRESD